jgi:hypothetical protein
MMQLKSGNNGSSDFTNTKAYEVGYRTDPMTPGLAVMT